MQIVIELDQEWGTVTELADYLQGIAEKLRQMSWAEPDWFFLIEGQEGEHTIKLTHL